MHRASEWRKRLKRGKEPGKFVCPTCGGHNFTVKDGRAGVVIAYCHNGCPDDDNRAQWLAEVTRIVFPEGDDQQSHTRRFAERGPGNPPRRPEGPLARSTRRIAAELWKAGQRADGTPARLYLAGRLAWPPDGVGCDLPPSVRWVDAKAAKEAGYALPKWAAGAVLYRFEARDGSGRAVSLDAVTDEGKRGDQLPDTVRFRRTLGARDGGTFLARRDTDDLCPLVLAEGEVTALATRHMVSSAAEVRAVGGAAALRSHAAQGVAASAVGRGRQVVVAADNDPDGRRSAATLQGAVPAVRIHVAAHGDMADDLARLVRLDAQLVGGALDSALRSAWPYVTEQLELACLSGLGGGLEIPTGG